jgi:hypothetical protein
MFKFSPWFFASGIWRESGERAILTSVLDGPVSGTRFALVPAQDFAVLVAPTPSEQNRIRLLAVERLELE